jgi:hypothetical protein
VYWEDALDHHGDFLGPPTEFVPWANALHEATWAGHTHLLSPGTIEVDGDVAHSECYVFWMLRRKDGTALDGGGASTSIDSSAAEASGGSPRASS